MHKRVKLAFGLQAPRRSHAEQFAEDQPHIPRRGLQQVAFGDFEQAGQPTSPRSARLAHVGETSLDAFTAKSLQALAAIVAEDLTRRN